MRPRDRGVLRDLAGRPASGRRAGFRRLRPVVACAAVLMSTVAQAQETPTPQNRIYVTDVASSLVAEGVALEAPVGPSGAAFEPVPSPGLRNIPNTAIATVAPWVDSNAWRFRRGVTRARYERLSPGWAPLAAAEAFAYGVDALLDPAAADVPELGNVLRFLRAAGRPRLPALVNFDVVDDGSPMLDEALNMLARRNLLYRVVSAPDPESDLTVQIGSGDFPVEAVADPSDFAARVRARVGDDRRIVRVYGSNIAIVHLTGDAARARLYLLSYSRNRRTQRSVRVRVLGRYRPAGVAAYGAAPEAALGDVRHPDGGTEFTLLAFDTIAIVDLDRLPGAFWRLRRCCRSSWRPRINPIRPPY